MKFFYILIILILFQSCSFDNKSGIWKNENIISKKDNDIFKEFENLSSSTSTFNQIIPISKNFKFKITSPTKILNGMIFFIIKTIIIKILNIII